MVVYAKLNTHIYHGPAIPLLDTYPTEYLHVFSKNIHKVIFMAALFAVAKNCNQLKCPSIVEKVNKWWHIRKQSIR